MNTAARTKAQPWRLLGILDALSVAEERPFHLRSQTHCNQGSCTPVRQREGSPDMDGVQMFGSQKVSDPSLASDSRLGYVPDSRRNPEAQNAGKFLQLAGLLELNPEKSLE